MNFALPKRLRSLLGFLFPELFALSSHRETKTMKFVFSITLAFALLATAPASAEGKIDVMTQNQYLGADLTPIITAPDAPSFNQALIDALEDVAANNYPARANRLAEHIADRLPDLVGLQEMFQFECYETGALPDACADPSIANAFNDHLQLTLDALAELDETYVDVATVNNLDTTGNLGIPGFPLPGFPVDLNFDGVPDIAVTVLDRDVVLVRDDLAAGAAPVDFADFQSLGICTKPSVDGCNFQTVASANSPIGPIAIERGFVGVDLNIEGTAYRFVNTHLEVQRPDPSNPLSPVVQAAQSAELIQTLSATTPPNVSLIIVGDINSSSEDPIIPGPLPLPSPFDQGIIPPYTQLVASGYTDAWTLRPGNQEGYSCCQLDDLSNHQSILRERIDVIFSAEAPVKVKKARVLGAKVADKTSPPGQGLWPSDHGTVAAELQFE